MSATIATAGDEDVPQKPAVHSRNLRNDFGVRISITPYRRSLPHLNVTITTPQLRELEWDPEHAVFALRIIRDGAGLPTHAQIRATGFNNENGRWLWKCGGAGLAGCWRGTFRLPVDMAHARMVPHEPGFRANIHTDAALNTLTIDLPPMPAVLA